MFEHFQNGGHEPEVVKSHHLRHIAGPHMRHLAVYMHDNNARQLHAVKCEIMRDCCKPEVAGL